MAKAKTVEKVTRITRDQAANQVITALKGKTTLSELAAQADALYVERGGDSKPKAAADYVQRALGTAESLGVVKLIRPTDLTIEKVR